MDKEWNLNRNTKRVDQEYWIDRKGKLHKFTGDLTCQYASFHAEIARQLFPNSNRATDILTNWGWITIGSSVYSTPIIDKKPTSAQIKRLESLNLYESLTISHEGYYIPYDENQHLFI